MTLDPAQAGTAGQRRQVALVFDPLVRLDLRTQRPQPRAGRRTDDQSRFTFTLRHARFHDRTPVTAADVKATLDRVAAQAIASPVAPLLSAVRGYGEAHDLGSAPGLAGVTAPDPRTVVVELARPFADFPVVLAHPGLGIVPRAQVPSLGDNPIGSGPFRVESRTQTSTTLQRFVSPGRVPQVDRIVLVPVPSADDGVRALRDKQVDAAPLDGIAAGAPAGAAVAQAPSLDVVSFGLNVRNLGFGDERFRRAVLSALNREKPARAAYGTLARPSNGVIPVGVPGARANACGDVCTPNATAAMQLAGQVFPDGNLPILTLDFPDRDDERRLAQEAQGELAEVGIPLTLSPHPPDGYAAFLAAGAAQLFVLPTVDAAPAAGLFLAPRFVSGASENVVGISNAQVDGRIATADAERKPSVHGQQYAAAARGVLDQVVVLPVAQLENRMTASRRVHDLDLDSLGTFDALAVRIVGRGSGERGG